MYILVGYSDDSKAYRLLDEGTGRIIKSRDVQFFENYNTVGNNVYEFLSTDFGSLSPQNCTENIEDTVVKPEVICEEEKGSQQKENQSCSDLNTPIPTSNEGSTQMRNLPGRPRILRTGKVGRPAKQYNQQSINNLKEGMSIPCSVAEAMVHPDSTLWREAMQSEYDALTSKG